MVVANIVSRNILATDFQPLLDKLSNQQPQLSQEFKAACDAFKKYLVVLLEPHLDPEGFQHSLLTSLGEQALEREGLSFRPPTHFSVALERISDWKTTQPEAYRKLAEHLETRHSSIDQLTAGLQAFKPEFFDLFREVYEQVAYGTPFDPNVWADTKKILRDTVKHLRSTGEWTGVFLICDEFGHYLSKLVNEPDSRESLSSRTSRSFVSDPMRISVT